MQLAIHGIPELPTKPSAALGLKNRKGPVCMPPALSSSYCPHFTFTARFTTTLPSNRKVQK